MPINAWSSKLGLLSAGPIVGEVVGTFEGKLEG